MYGWWRGEGVLSIDQGGNASVRDVLTLELRYPGTWGRSWRCLVFKGVNPMDGWLYLSQELGR